MVRNCGCDKAPSDGPATYTEKYFACGLSTTIALVDCSGWSWNSSDNDNPIRSAPSKERIGA